MERANKDKAAHNRRRNPRRLTFWNGHLVTPKGQFDCRVVDMSDTGAQVRLVQKSASTHFPVLGPGPITLIITRMGRFTGSVAWQHGAALGLRLARLPASESASDRDSGHAERSAAVAIAEVASGSTTRKGAVQQDHRTRTRDGDKTFVDPLLRGLVDWLPPGGTEWSVVDRVKWLQTAADIFDLIYKGDGGIKIEPTVSGMCYGTHTRR